MVSYRALRPFELRSYMKLEIRLEVKRVRIDSITCDSPLVIVVSNPVLSLCICDDS